MAIKRQTLFKRSYFPHFCDLAHIFDHKRKKNNEIDSKNHLLLSKKNIFKYINQIK